MLHDLLWGGNAKLEWSVYTDPKVALSSDPYTLSCLLRSNLKVVRETPSHRDAKNRG